jgi:uncharacterized lipoprotein YajG
MKLLSKLFIAAAGLFVVASCVEPTQTTITGPSGAIVSTAKCSQSPRKLPQEGC